MLLHDQVIHLLESDSPFLSEQDVEVTMLFGGGTTRQGLMRMKYADENSGIVITRNKKTRMMPFSIVKKVETGVGQVRFWKQTGVVSDMLDLESKPFVGLELSNSPDPMILVFGSERIREDFVNVAQLAIRCCAAVAKSNERAGEASVIRPNFRT
eukprot:GHVU01132716.1.p4 GENE.GHVU01132716.1~~GHVU01132716.1.p4  ORF type:complete len:155 (+),score=13.33 GHVU01132716.1:644-1108(+)